MSSNDQNSKLPTARGTGFALAAFSLLTGLVLFRDAQVCLIVSLVAASLLVALAVWAPHSLRPLHRLLIRLSRNLNAVLHPLVMALVFMFAIVPVSIFMQHGNDSHRRRRMQQKNASRTTLVPS